MAVKFLSDEWAQALKTELNASESFKEAAAGKTATIQQVIGGGDERDPLLDQHRRRSDRHGYRRCRRPPTPRSPRPTRRPSPSRRANSLRSRHS